MRLNQNILNAINEGIRKSLLSFDDIEFVQSTNTNQKVSNTINDWDLDQKGFVNLGLPSGTLWAKCNIGATCGDTPKSWYGNYYAWGETETKNIYDANGYTYIKNPKELPLNRDVAYLINNLMCIPSLEQFNELKSLPNEWVKDYNGVSGLNGRIFTGPNGNTLFIPAAGYCHGSNVYSKGSDCYLCSSHPNLSCNYYAYYLYFNTVNINIVHNECYYGYSVRPVLLKQ